MKSHTLAQQGGRIFTHGFRGIESSRLFLSSGGRNGNGTGRRKGDSMRAIDLLIGVTAAVVAVAIMPPMSAADTAALIIGGGGFLGVMAWQGREWATER